MTCNVLMGTLNPTHSLTHPIGKMWTSCTNKTDWSLIPGLGCHIQYTAVGMRMASAPHSVTADPARPGAPIILYGTQMSAEAVEPISVAEILNRILVHEWKSAGINMIRSMVQSNVFVTPAAISAFHSWTCWLHRVDKPLSRSVRSTIIHTTWLIALCFIFLLPYITVNKDYYYHYQNWRAHWLREIIYSSCTCFTLPLLTASYVAALYKFIFTYLLT